MKATKKGVRIGKMYISPREMGEVIKESNFILKDINQNINGKIKYRKVR